MKEEHRERVVYLISGPLGVGKSTTTKELASRIAHGVRIEGDILLHMLHDGLPLAWEERLRIAWKNILALSRNFVEEGLNVVVDFVVEDELAWFCEQLSDLNVQIKYAVLRADPEQIAERLTARGDLAQSLERSLFLLGKLESAPANLPFLFDTTRKKPQEAAEAILLDPRFFIRQ